MLYIYAKENKELGYQQGMGDICGVFFGIIQKRIEDFLYIPLISEDTLSEFKKHLYLGVLTRQLTV